jgi:hypothetical protein
MQVGKSHAVVTSVQCLHAVGRDEHFEKKEEDQCNEQSSRWVDRGKVCASNTAVATL